MYIGSHGLSVRMSRLRHTVYSMLLPYRRHVLDHHGPKAQIMSDGSLRKTAVVGAEKEQIISGRWYKGRSRPGGFDEDETKRHDHLPCNAR